MRLPPGALEALLRDAEARLKASQQSHAKTLDALRIVYGYVTGTDGSGGYDLNRIHDIVRPILERAEAGAL